MKKNRLIMLASSASLVFLFGSAGAIADDNNAFPGDVEQGDSWQAPPYDFNFGNHIDTHIQLRLKTRKGEPKFLKGALYIYFTGGTDKVSGLPLARHPRGMSHGEVCGIDPITCVAAWKIKGRPGAAKYLYHGGVNGNDHPVWMVNRAEEASAPAAGMVIPQPGYYSHYHWITSASQDPRADMVSVACEKQTAGQLETVAPTAVNEICDGWFLQLRATTSFAFMHGGEIIPIYKGADLRSHLNIVMNYTQSPIVKISYTRMSDGGH